MLIVADSRYKSVTEVAVKLVEKLKNSWKLDCYDPKFQIAFQILLSEILLLENQITGTHGSHNSLTT
jgi:hypothetical protein